VPFSSSRRSTVSSRSLRTDTSPTTASRIESMRSDAKSRYCGRLPLARAPARTIQSMLSSAIFLFPCTIGVPGRGAAVIFLFAGLRLGEDRAVHHRLDGGDEQVLGSEAGIHHDLLQVALVHRGPE